MNGGWTATAALLAFMVGCILVANLSNETNRDRVKAGVMVLDAKAYRITPLDAH